MTPELCALAAGRFASVLAVDASPEAIALYRDRLPSSCRARETVACARRCHLPALVADLARPVRAVLGDGVFGNLLGRRAHLELLGVLRDALAPGGCFVTRHATYPVAYDFHAQTAGRLLARFRRGGLDAAEPGFAMRMTGHAAVAWRRSDGRLRNARVFRWCDEARARGELTQGEQEAIERYRFDGDDTVLPQDAWEAPLERAGFRWRKRTLAGRRWYAYYPIYAARSRPRRDARGQEGSLDPHDGSSKPPPRD